ncbi:MAG TPA: OmpH family outer membrane protein [Elusimicrobiota bacterium]|nr:OmpH family outer membrane protein [Elusimicrobiota bacterium]
MSPAHSQWNRTFVAALAVAGCAVAAGSSLGALEIPLKRGANQATRVGFVDMDKIFREYPETQKARAEYYKALEKRRSELAAREKELAALDGPAPASAPATPPVISTGLFALPPDLMSPTASTGPAAIPAPDPEEREAVRREKQAEIAEARAAAARELKELEEKKSVQILGSLYKTLVQLAQEKGVDLVVDKSAILYGQNAIDLTEPLARRLRGLPDDGKP